jgi:dihydroflavonol-4-reductase
MIVAVTGACGHLGSTLVRDLVREGHQVRVLLHSATSNPRSLAGLDVHTFTGDVRNIETLHPLVRGAEVVFHLAAIISIDGDRRGVVRAVNVDGARNSALAALRAGVRRHVHVSSVHAFDHFPLSEPVTESSRRPGPRHPAYDRTKAAGEEAVREVIAQGLDAVIVNPSGILGPLDFAPSRLGGMLIRTARGRIPASANGGFDWVDVRDVARSVAAAAHLGTSGQNYLLPGAYLSSRGILELAASVAGVRPPRPPVPRAVERLGADVLTVWGRLRGREPLYTREALHALMCNPAIEGARAANELGHAPRPLEETMRDTLAWFAHNGHLPKLRDRFAQAAAE